MGKIKLITAENIFYTYHRDRKKHRYTDVLKLHLFVINQLITVSS